MNATTYKYNSIFTPWAYLFNHPKIITCKDDSVHFNDLVYVDMDEMMVTVGKTKCIATDSLSACMAFCSLGKTSEGTSVLGLWHRTPWWTNIEDGLAVLNKKMARKKCIADSITTFVIGGLAPDAEDPDGSIAEELRILSMADRKNIKGVLFNYCNNELKPLSVVLTPDLIFVSKDVLFSINSSKDSDSDSSEDSLENCNKNILT